MGAGHRFEEPPVREVALTVFFERIPTLQALNLAQLRVNWGASYPKVGEVPPRLPIRGRQSYLEYLSTNSFWPMPLTTFTNNRGDQAIELQSDRFSLVWRFDEGPKAYPGYNVLSQELLTRFREFREGIAESVLAEVKVTDAILSYTNHVAGYKPESLALGILTGWVHDLSITASADVASLKLHYCSPYKDDDAALTVVVDQPKSDENEEPASSLELEASISIRDGQDLEKRIRTAHDLLGQKFLDIANDDLRRRWGFQDE
jgi:uncharacterized protein (TIGR04255 family)